MTRMFLLTLLPTVLALLQATVKLQWPLPDTLAMPTGVRPTGLALPLFLRTSKELWLRLSLVTHHRFPPSHLNYPPMAALTHPLCPLQVPHMGLFLWV